MVGDALLETHYAIGIERLDSFAAQFIGTRRLSEEDLAAYRPRTFSAGWDIPGLCEDGPVTSLRLLVDTRFPFKPPHIAIYPPLPVLSHPNLEEEGCLCLSPAGASFSVERIESLAMELLDNARQLVNGWYHHQGMERFEDEFNSYWLRWANGKAYFVSLCNPSGPSRWVWAFKNKSTHIFADDEAFLQNWLPNYFLNLSQKPDICRMPFICLPRAPLPEQYPDTVQKLFALVDGDQKGEAMIRQLIRENQFKHSRRVLLSFKVHSGTGFAGLLLPSKDVSHIEDGFRKGHLPFGVLMQRYDVKPVKGVPVTRCDPSWVHGRDNNPAVPVLQAKTVVILGIGSLGSGVAELLAKIGVGKLILVDPECIEPENACRHSLGIDSMPLNKASAMATQLIKRFPHLKCLAYSQQWELQYQATPSVFESADLIISAIGSWASESALNALTLKRTCPPVLYGWLEPHAAAGHAAVFFGGERKCLRCITDDMGQPTLMVTRWPEEGTQLSVPACGGMFQPYGATELAFAQGIVADLATEVLLGEGSTSKHRVWVGQRKLHNQNGGEWHPDWVGRHGDPGDGGFIKDLEVPASLACPICGRSPGE